MPRFGPRPLLAAFSGARTHPCREALFALDDGERIRCQVPPSDRYLGRVDAGSGAGDEAYAALLTQATFALVPRGDQLFSYRLLEAMSFGAIPVVLSDGWVLPLDRTVRWSDFSFHLPESQAADIPPILASFSLGRIAELQAALLDVWWRCFHSLGAVVETLLIEAEALLSR